MQHRLSVAVQTPAHSAIAGPLTYSHSAALPPGSLVRVPLGTRETLGVVWDGTPPESDFEVRPLSAALDGLPPLNAAWRGLVQFAALYYQRAVGEVALAALPPQLRELGAASSPGGSSGPPKEPMHRPKPL